MLTANIQIQIREVCQACKGETKLTYCNKCNSSKHVKKWVPVSHLLQLLLELPIPDGEVGGHLAPNPNFPR